MFTRDFDARNLEKVPGKNEQRTINYDQHRNPRTTATKLHHRPAGDVEGIGQSQRSDF